MTAESDAVVVTDSNAALRRTSNDKSTFGGDVFTQRGYAKRCGDGLALRAAFAFSCIAGAHPSPGMALGEFRMLSGGISIN